MTEADKGEVTLLERMKKETGPRSLLGFAVYRLTTSADMLTFLTEFLNQTVDSKTRTTIYGQARRSLIGHLEDPYFTNRERDNWLHALDVVNPSVEQEHPVPTQGR